MDSPFGLFKKKEEKKLEEKEVEDLNKLKPADDILSSPEEVAALKPPEPTELTKSEEATKLEELPKPPEEIPPPEEVPKPAEEILPPVEVERKEEIPFDETPLVDLHNRIVNDLRDVKEKFKEITKASKELTLDSPEIVDLLDLYVDAKKKFEGFIDEINRMNLERITSRKSVAAVYKFRACKKLADLKKQIKRIDEICKKAGFIPMKVHEILHSKAEDLVNSLLKEKKKKK